MAIYDYSEKAAIVEGGANGPVRQSLKAWSEPEHVL